MTEIPGSEIAHIITKMHHNIVTWSMVSFQETIMFLAILIKLG